MITDKNPRQSLVHSLPIIEPAPHLLSLSVQILIAISAIIALTMVAILFVFVKRKGKHLISQPLPLYQT
jgi:hypothetical protein